MPTRRMHNVKPPANRTRLHGREELRRQGLGVALAVTVFLLFLTIAGCAPYPPIDGSPPAGTKETAAANDALRNQTKTLEKENAAYQKQIADQEAEIAVLSKSMADREAEIAKTQKQVSELNKSIDDLNTQVKQLQEARKETPLKETELVQTKKEPVQPATPAPSPKKKESKKLPGAKGRKPEAADDVKALTKQLPSAKLKKSTRSEAAPVRAKVKKEQETPAEAGKDLTRGKQKESAELKALESRSVDDLSAQMKEFEEAEAKAGTLKETAPAPAKKEQGKSAKNVKSPAKDARTEPPEGKARDLKAVKIKVLAGDGNIDSAKKMSQQLSKMGYRVKATDLAPRSDFDANTVFYGPEHRVAAEAMVKKLGKSAVTRPLNWSTTFDIIVVTGRRR